MPRKRNTPVTSETDESADLAEETFGTATHQVEPDAIELAAATLTGDLRDFILDRLRHEQSKRPWHERTESEQRATVHDVDAAVRRVVQGVIETIAAGGRKTIKATLESVTVKDGIKAVLLLSKSDEERHKLIDATGDRVLIVVADADEFTGERDPVEIKPDQPEMFKGGNGAGVMAEHSESDASPFH